GPEGAENALPLNCGALGQAQPHWVALCSANHGVSDSCVATGGIENGLAGPQGPRALPLADHVQRGAVLHRAARVEPLRFGVKLAAREFTGYWDEPQQRGVADPVEEGDTSRHRRRLGQNWISCYAHSQLNCLRLPVPGCNNRAGVVVFPLDIIA